MGLRPFFAELRRRRIARVAVVYAGVAFVLLQLADILVPALRLPQWTVQLIVVLGLLGFPIALVLAWAFEVTPEGVRRTENAPPSDAAGRKSPPWLSWRTALMAFGLFAAGGIGGWLSSSVGRDRSPSSRAGTEAARSSIAVLPFVNMSADEENAYFSDGLSEELLNALAKVPGLRVAARTSSFAFKGRNEDIREIGESLGVKSVLEGSVRKSNGRVRITAQLIQVSDGFHLWSETFDRRLDDIFAIQEEIARAIVDHLKVRLMDGKEGARSGGRLVSIPTQNLEAYEAYLRGNEQRTRWEAAKAIESYERAVELDPSFAVAYAAMSQAHAFLFHNREDPTEERLSKAKAAVDRAFALQPALAEAHVAMGYYYYWGYRDYDAALEEFSAARAQIPNNGEVLLAIGVIRKRQGKFEEAARLMETAHEIDPLNGVLIEELAGVNTYLRRYERADRLFEKMIEANPKALPVYYARAFNMLLWRGINAERSQDMLAKLARLPFPDIELFWVYVDAHERKFQSVLDRLDGMPFDVFTNQNIYLPKPLLAGLLYDAAGESALAQASYESALAALQREIANLPDDFRIHIALGQTYAGLDRKEDAVREGNLAVELAANDAIRHEAASYLFAQILARAGALDASVALLEELLSKPGLATVPRLRTDPAFDPLREHPRFRKLVAERS